MTSASACELLPMPRNRNLTEYTNAESHATSKGAVESLGAAPRRSALRDSGQERKARRNVLAFRAVAALLVTCLAEGHEHQTIDPKLTFFVSAVEEWIGEARANDDCEPEKASQLEGRLSRCLMQHRRRGNKDPWTRIAEARGA